MPMGKSKGKSSMQRYECATCEMMFEGEPHATICHPHTKMVDYVCSDPCWLVCLKGHADALNYFEDFIDLELGDFVEIIGQRADYEFILESIKARIENLRYEMIENQLKQLEQNEK